MRDRLKLIECIHISNLLSCDLACCFLLFAFLVVISALHFALLLSFFFILFHSSSSSFFFFFFFFFFIFCGWDSQVEAYRNVQTALSLPGVPPPQRLLQLNDTAYDALLRIFEAEEPSHTDKIAYFDKLIEAISVRQEFQNFTRQASLRSLSRQGSLS